MIKTLLIALALFMTGCYQKVNHAEIKKAEKFCADKAGVDYIREDATGATAIYCLDGSNEYDVEITLTDLTKT